jgi:hypothetical protein
MITLGVKAKDVVTGLTGIVTGRAQYLTGCDQYSITCKASEEGVVNSRWVDENSIEVMDNKPIVLPGSAENPGGPSNNPAPLK